MNNAAVDRIDALIKAMYRRNGHMSDEISNISDETSGFPMKF